MKRLIDTSPFSRKCFTCQSTGWFWLHLGTEDLMPMLWTFNSLLPLWFECLARANLPHLFHLKWNQFMCSKMWSTIMYYFFLQACFTWIHMDCFWSEGMLWVTSKPKESRSWERWLNYWSYDRKSEGNKYNQKILFTENVFPRKFRLINPI